MQESTSAITTRELDESSLGIPGDQTVSSLQGGSSSKESNTNIPDHDSDKLSDRYTSDDDDHDDDDSPENSLEGHTLNLDPAQGHLVSSVGSL